MNEPEWLVPPLDEGCWNGCMNCAGAPKQLDLSTSLAVGFGAVTVSDNGAVIWSGDDEDVTAGNFETLAVIDPDHDWRIRFDAPMWGATYQRHGEGEWNMIEKNRGWA